MSEPREPTEADRVALREWLDRRPLSGSRWESWFAFEWVGVGDDGRPVYESEYLGTRYARTKPDDVNAAQRCVCPVCLGTVGE